MRPTRSYDKVHSGARVQALRHGVSVYDLANTARAAGFVFVSDARFGWARRELATWLACDYRGAVLDAGEDAPRTFRRSTAEARAIDEVTVTRLVASARRHVVDMLASAPVTWNAHGFAREMIDGGLVIGVCDERGGIGYAPLHRPRMRLADRLASLFIADFLTRPRDYDSLAVCSTCDEVSFAWDDVHDEACEARVAKSGFVRKQRDRRATDPGLGG